MKRIFGILVIGLLGYWGSGKAQTSYYELKLYSTSNKLVSGKNVDLYQGVTKIYDLSESASVPGVYYHATVAHGEYDIYVNGSSWKTGIWIGAEKVSDVVNLFRMNSPDTLEITGHIKATSLEGDGSKITGLDITGSGGLENTGDTIIGADSDSNDVGAIYMKTRGRNRLIIGNDGQPWIVDGVLVVGNANDGTPAGVTANSVQVHDDTSAYLIASRIYPGSGARYAMMVADDYDNVIKFASSKTGTVPDGNDEWPMVFQIGSNKPVKIYEDNTVIIGSANNGSPAGVTSPSVQVHADTSAYVIASRIYGSGTGARYAMMVADDYDNVIKFASSKTGTVPDGNAEWPMTFQIGSNKPLKLYADSVVATKDFYVYSGAADGKVATVSSSGKLTWSFETRDLAAGGFFNTTSNGGVDTTVSYIPAKKFSTSTAETCAVDFALPHANSTLDSVYIWSGVPSTAGDSVSYKIQVRSVALGGTGSFASALTDIKDMGTTANVPVLFSYAVSGVSGRRQVTIKLWRDPSISNDATSSSWIGRIILVGRRLR